jgi:UDPglucose--hexose-1-phosphate uridylyltransferase
VDEISVDPLTGSHVVVVGDRQGRPMLPADPCPFCPGGLEAPEPYEVRWFANRWPALPEDRAEIVLYTPEHDATLWSLGQQHVRRVVDLWAERTSALGGRPDVAYVLVFENRGAEVGATVTHPHGQVYAFAEVPPVPLQELAAATCSLCAEHPGDRLVADAGGWRAWVPAAAAWPYGVVLAPVDHMPYMLWIHQRPTDGAGWPMAHVHVEVAPLLRSAGTPRFVAAGELGSGVFFNPVAPVDAACNLRAAGG